MHIKLTQLLFSALLLLACQLATAQTPTACPSNSTPPADFCEDMCVLCNLSTYTGSTSGYTGQTPPAFCGTIENEQWLGFVASAPAATITAFPSNCTDGNGVQVALFTSCNSDPIQGGCNGGGAGFGDTPVSITVALTPGTVYYLMVDGYAGDQCDFLLTVSPPATTVQGQIITQQIPLCSGKTFVYEGVEYTAPGVVKDTLPAICGDTIFVYNLVEAPPNNFTQNIQFCLGESVVVNGVTFTEPGTYLYNITATAGGCDTAVTVHLEWLPQPTRAETIVLQPGVPVVIGGNTYFAPGIVTDTLPAAVGCDTVVTYTLLLDLTVSDTCLVSKGFLKKIGEQGLYETGNVICAAADGNLYIAGEKEEESLLMKVAPSGAVLWSRSFTPAPPLATHITDLIEDSEGMLAGCGIVGEGDVNLKSYAFRYNPSTGLMIWSKILQQQSPEAFTILEKEPGGNFLLLTSPQLALNVDDAEMWELNRNTGALLNGLTRRYNYGISDVFTSMVIHNGAIYAAGRHIPTLGPIPPTGKTRMGLSKFDLATGAPIWSRLSHLDTSVVAFLRGGDLLVHDNALLALYSGTDSANINAQQAFFLQKTSLDGDLLWVKRYSLPGHWYSAAHDILRMSDGYVFIGTASKIAGEFNIVILKTDFDGNPLWAKNVASSFAVNAGSSQYNNGQHSAVVVNDVLLLTGVTEDIPTDALYLKMTSDGEAGDSCVFIEPLNVQVEAVPNPVNLPIQLALFQNIGQLTNNTQVFSPADMPVATYCVSCLLDCDDTLDLGPDIILCKDSTLVFNAGGNFVSYLWQDGSTDSTFTTNQIGVYWVEVTDACGDKQRDSVLLTVSLVGDVKLADTTICAGGSLTLSVPDFDVYTWSPAAGLSCTNCATVTIQPSATTVYALYAENDEGCSKTDTFTVTVVPLNTRSELVEFCPGESVTVGGSVYTQPGTIIDTIPSAGGGCDTIVTYTLQFNTTPNSSVSINCPDNIDIPTNPGTGPVAVNYNLPVASSDCECPGIALTRTQGLPSGSLFPVTTTQVCYQAKDSCGNAASCCFEVTIREELPCDVKNTGCMKYELLGITRGSSSLNLTYRIRATNTCANKMIYTAIQLPDGIVAVSPANNSVYTAPSNRQYDVRNPNYSPFYSVRFKSKLDSISGGQSDIFEYTLPPQINPAYIHITSRLYPQIFQEAHLNTFKCPIEIVQDKPGQRTDLSNFEHLTNLRVFPNPTIGILFADLSDWQGEQLQVQIFNSQGQRVQHLTLVASDEAQEIQLPDGLAAGLYFLEVLRENGEKQAARFVIQR